MVECSFWFILFYFVYFVALRPISIAMVMAGWSVHLTTLFPGQAWTSGLPVVRAHTFACNWQQPFLNKSVEGRRMTVEIISWSISFWDKGVVGLSFSGGTMLCPCARHVMLYLVLVQPRKHPNMTENFLTGIKVSTQIIEVHSCSVLVC